jgi:hypothetical protein
MCNLFYILISLYLVRQYYRASLCKVSTVVTHVKKQTELNYHCCHYMVKLNILV